MASCDETMQETISELKSSSSVSAFSDKDEQSLEDIKLKIRRMSEKQVVRHIPDNLSYLELESADGSPQLYKKLKNQIEDHKHDGPSNSELDQLNSLDMLLEDCETQNPIFKKVKNFDSQSFKSERLTLKQMPRVHRI